MVIRTKDDELLLLLGFKYISPQSIEYNYIRVHFQDNMYYLHNDQYRFKDDIIIKEYAYIYTNIVSNYVFHLY